MSSVWYSLLLLSHQKSASTQQAALAELAMVMTSRAVMLVTTTSFILTLVGRCRCVVVRRQGQGRAHQRANSFRHRPRSILGVSQPTGRPFCRDLEAKREEVRAANQAQWLRQHDLLLIR